MDFDDILDRFGFEDGNECRHSPHGHHEPTAETHYARCFWCSEIIRESLGDDIDDDAV